MGVWTWLACLVVVGLAGVVPLVARWVVDGREGRAALALVGFVALCTLTGPSHAVMPPGAVYLGTRAELMTCAEGDYIFFYRTTGTGTTQVDLLTFDGMCPSAAQWTCGSGAYNGNGTHIQSFTTGTCVSIYGSGGGQGGTFPGGGGGSVTGTVSLKPFDLSTEDGSLVAGAIAALWLAAWAMKATRKTLNGPKDED